jgi:hypothetical protein
MGLASFGEILLGQPQFAANERVRAEAVGALVGLGDRESNLLANLRVELSIRERGTEREIPLKRSGGVAQYANQVGDDAEFPLHAVEESFRLARCGLRSSCAM